MKNLSAALAAAVMALAVSHAVPVRAAPLLEVFTLQSTLPQPGDPELFHHELTLPAGVYSVGVVSGAWNAWFFDGDFETPGFSGPHALGCDPDGTHCDEGWLNIFRVQINGDPHAAPTTTAEFFWDGAPTFDQARFETPEQARDAATWHSFEVTDPSAVVTFSIFDDPYDDNLGTLTLALVAGRLEGPTPVPEPASIGLLASALLLLGPSRRLRKQKN